MDFSESSRTGVDYAAWLAGRLPGRVRLLHVWTPFNGPGQLSPDRNSIARTERVAIALLDRWRRELESIGVDCCTQIEAGPVAKTIVHVTAECSADLIVIAARGADAIPEIALGGVAERVIRMSHRPVLCVGARAPSPLDRIVVALDLGSNGDRLVEHAHQLDPAAGPGKVRLVHVLEEPSPLYACLEDAEVERYRAALRRAAEDDLARRSDPFEIRRGSLAKELASASGNARSILVVGAGTGSRAGAIRRAALGAGASVLNVPV